MVYYPSKRVFKFRTPLPRKGTVKQGHPWFRLVRRKTRRTEHERVGKTPIHLRCEKCSHGTNRSSPLLRQKRTPRNRASLCILSWNFTSLLTFIRILLFPCFQFLPTFFAGVQFLNFRCEESCEGINDGLRQFNLVWILTFFLAGYSVLPQQQNLSGSTQSISHSFPAIYSCQRLFPYTEGKQVISKPEKIIIELLSHPFRGFHRKSPHKIARIGREWIELNWVYLSFSFYLPSGFRTSRKRITVLVEFIIQTSGVP